MENERLIKKIAWSFHRTTDIDLKDLISEANLAYCKAMLTFDVSLNYQFSTYATKVIKRALVDFTKEERKRKYLRYDINKFLLDFVDESEGLLYYPEPLKVYPVSEPIEFCEDWPEDCKKIVNIILNHQEEIDPSLAPKLARGKVIEILRQEGFSWPKIWNGIRYIKLALR